MPTARELLEQADALMRRNRSPVLDDIPVLTDSVPALPPTRVLRGRPPGSRPPEPAAGESDTIPMLTEKVAADAPAAESPIVAEGEPSDWLQLGQGEPSAIGEAPDSIAIVPQVVPGLPPPEDSPAEEIEITASPAEAEQAFDEEIAEHVPPAPPPVPAEPPPSAALLASAYTSTAAPMPDLAFIEDPTVSDMDALDDDVPTLFGTERPAPSEEPPAPSEEPPAPSEEPPAPSEEPPAPSEEPPAPAEELTPPVEEPPAPAEPEPQRAPESIEDALLGAPLETAAALAASAAAENARWVAVAEEIRVQVLQRIDLFTDTGLREQLGSRLQPIVDRASADLVATINQHVGELLRAYVAEAIEREIENWRQNR